MNNWINANKIKLYSCSEAFARECNLQLVEAIPVSSLEELFSKSGEQLAREMYPDHIGYTKEYRREAFLEAYNLQQVKIDSNMLDIDSLLSEFKRQGFNVDNWDGEQSAEKAIVDGVIVVVAELRADLEKANKLFNSIKIPFDVDEMRSNYDRMAEENGQMLVNCANWKRELAAKNAEIAELKEDLSIYKDEISNYAKLVQGKDAQVQALKKEVEELREQIAALKEGYEGDEHLEHE